MMDQLIADWTTLADDVHATAYEIFKTANVPVTTKNYRDEKLLALTLLARTASNAKSALILLKAKRVIEARVLVRCCLENSYWVAGLEAGGEKFSQEMLNDEMSHRQHRGQRLFDPNIALDDTTKAKLAAWLKESGKRFKDAKQLKPKAVALRGVLAKSYTFYEQLSCDAAHPSLDALNRHIIPHTRDETGGVDVDPLPRPAEIAETLEYFCMATIGALVGVNQIIGGTTGGQRLESLADRFKPLSDRSRNADVTRAAHISPTT